ncbi:hypothetical protein Agub_g14648, partial [Astrephomene gubernaculifera]
CKNCSFNSHSGRGARMLALRADRQPQRRTGVSGRIVRRASENATKVPVSKKCKLDIKRKHLKAAIPGCLSVNSYAVNLQLQIDGEKLPDLYKCTIKKHVNNKTSCVSYRLQGTGIYNYLRGLYMRGFCCGDDPGVVVLVASSEAAPDLSYSGQSDGEDADEQGEARAVAREDTDSEAEKRPQRQRRQQRPRQQRKRRRDESEDEQDEDIGQLGTVPALEGLSGQQAPAYMGYLLPAQVEAFADPHEPHPFHQPHLFLQQQFNHHHHQQQHFHHHLLQQEQFPQQQFQQEPLQPLQQYHHERLRSHPLHSAHQSPNGGDPAHMGLHSDALPGGCGDDSSAALVCHEGIDDDGVSALDVAGVAEDVAAAVAEVERRAARECSISGTSIGLPAEPKWLDHLAIGVGLDGVGGLADGSSLLSGGGAGGTGLLELGSDGGITGPEINVSDGGGVGGGESSIGGGNGQQHGAAGLPGGCPRLQSPLNLSPFSPRLLQELTGRPHLPRGLGQQQPAHTWGQLPPLDFDTNYASNLWPRQQLAWPDSLGIGML